MQIVSTTHNQRVVHVLVLQSLQTCGVDVDVILLGSVIQDYQRGLIFSRYLYCFHQQDLSN